MAWQPVAGLVPQYQKANGDLASGYYLKFYANGTSTAINMATDNTGGTELAKCQVNSAGYPITASSAIFIPHIDQLYKISLFPTSADADANTNAEWTVDNLEPLGDTQITSNVFYAENYATFALAVAAAAGKELVISTVITVSSPETVSDLTLRFIQGGRLDPDTAIILTLNCDIKAGEFKIFGGAGTVTSTASVLFEILPEWWGLAVGSSPAVNTASIIASFAFASASTGRPRVTVSAGTFQIDPILIPDTQSVFFRGAYRETTVFENQSTTGDAFNFPGEHDSLVLEHFNIKHASSSTGIAINFPSGAGKATRDIHINHVAFEKHTIGIFAGNVINVTIENIWRGTGNSVSGVSNEGIGIETPIVSTGEPTDVTIKNVYLSNYDVAIKTAGTRTRVYNPILESFGTAAIQLTDSAKCYVMDPSIATAAGFSATGAYIQPAGTYFYIKSLREGFSNISLPFNHSENGRMTYIPEKPDSIQAFGSLSTNIITKATSFITYSDWTIIKLNSDIAATSTNDWGQDTEGHFDTGTYKYTAPFPGKYMLGAQVTWDLRNSGLYAIGIFVNNEYKGLVAYNTHTQVYDTKELTGSKTYDVPNIAAGSFDTTTVTVTGANLSESPRAIAALNTNTTNLNISANVTSNNTVTVVFNNNSGSAIDPASATLRCSVLANLGLTLVTQVIPTMPVVLDRGDTVELRAYQDSGGNQTVIASRGDGVDPTDNSGVATADPPHATALYIHGPVD